MKRKTWLPGLIVIAAFLAVVNVAIVFYMQVVVPGRSAEHFRHVSAKFERLKTEGHESYSILRVRQNSSGDGWEIFTPSKFNAPNHRWSGVDESWTDF
jgi:hypothetical protein